MILVELPTCKLHWQYLTLGKDYRIVGTVGNGYIIETDPGSEEERVIILQSRFGEKPPLVCR